jgi:two-component system chemotaxis sensor kinase CheA
MPGDPEHDGEIPIDRATLLEAFTGEATELLAAMEQGLLVLEKSPDDAETIHELFRAAHTLKGSASLVALDAVRGLGHDLESLLEQVRAGTLRAGGGVVTLLLRAVDMLKKLVAGGGEAGPELAPLRAELVLAAAGRTSEAPGLPGPTPEPAAGLVQSAVAPAPAPAPSGARTLRVEVARLDRMLDLAGEIGIARGRLADLLERPGVTREQLVEAHRSTDRLHHALQDLIMQARLVPLGPTFRQHQRTVRDLAAAEGKQVRLVLEGEEVEVDTAVVEHIRDPLTHMVRNAIDHGIERPQARVARGKDPCGQLTVRAFHEGSQVVVQVSDDGNGLDRERILRRAVERHLVADGAALTDDEVFAFVFEPGFSTAERVTDVSGRGVGMDVVRKNAELLRGSAAVSSTPGRGATVSMRLPLTLAIIEGFGVQVAEDVYILPLDAVVECLELPAVGERRRTGVLELRGKPLPYLRLRHQLGHGGEGPERENVVVVEHAGATVGLAVDALLGESQAVIKPLGRMFRAVRGVSGSTILGDGRVALILDVGALLREALPRAASAAPSGPAPSAEVRG